MSTTRSSSKARNGNRGKIEIMADILSICTVGIKKTRVMYKANLSYEQINYYLAELLGHEFIFRDVSEDRLIYRTTEKGREYLHHYFHILKLLDHEERHGELVSDQYLSLAS
jgi:predicted transcriptional regulator